MLSAGVLGIACCCPLAGAADSLLLDGFGAFANARGVEQRHRKAVEIEMHFDNVARSAGVRRDDCGLAPRQPIKQCRFPGIGRTRDGNNKTITQALAAMPVGKYRRNLVA